MLDFGRITLFCVYQPDYIDYVHHIVCCWTVVCNCLKHINHKTHFTLYNVTCCIDVSSNTVRII